MVNVNGSLVAKDTHFLNHTNRGVKYGDSLFETLRVVGGKVFFSEPHYLRLMASMRILRMEIPMTFTLEFFEEEILKTAKAANLDNARVRFTVYRDANGLYLPSTNNVAYLIEASALENAFYILNDAPYEVELFKDFYVNTDLLSTLKSSNRLINVVGSIFADENDYQNCLLLNNNKSVVEALNGNLFLVKGNTIKTPPLTDGCLNGIVRKQLISILEKLEDYEIEEASISPFELQKADELFITNSITGIQPITKYRKKQFGNKVSKELLGKLNAKARLS